MAKWEKGQSGNPKGRPPTGRALTEILEKSLGKSLRGGRSMKRKEYIAEQITKAITEGQVEFSDGTIVKAESFNDWAALAKWIYTHIDGSKMQTDVSFSDPFPLKWADDDAGQKQE